MRVRASGRALPHASLCCAYMLALVLLSRQQARCEPVLRACVPFRGRCRFRKTKWLMGAIQRRTEGLVHTQEEDGGGAWAAYLELPTDVDERYYWVLVDVSALHRNLHEEEIGVPGTSELTHDQANELRGAGGLLAAGSTLSIM